MLYDVSNFATYPHLENEIVFFYMQFAVKIEILSNICYVLFNACCLQKLQFNISSALLKYFFTHLLFQNDEV